MWPDVSISGGQATMLGTLINTIAISMLKDAYESITTYYRDKKENETKVTYFDVDTKKW
jgi:hypothetical protein